MPHATVKMLTNLSLASVFFLLGGVNGRRNSQKARGVDSTNNQHYVRDVNIATLSKSCYSDTSGSGGPLLPANIIFSAAGSATECVAICCSFVYAGFDGSRCYCGNTMNTQYLPQKQPAICSTSGSISTHVPVKTNVPIQRRDVAIQCRAARYIEILVVSSVRF